MEQTVNLKKVQSAILHLRAQGERVSRRNVRSITGGGMSTVHKLMSEVEDFEALQAIAPKDGISELLHNTILAEMGEQIKQATAKLQEQIRQLQTRESEALDALAEVETINERLEAELEETTQQASQLQKSFETAETVAKDTIDRLEQSIIDLHPERQRCNEDKEATKIELVKTQLQIEAAQQTANNAEEKNVQLLDDIQKQKLTQTETEKRAAISAQRATDLREALVKAEKRIKSLVQNGEPRQRK
jgi:chromosome segregation ATPase